MQPHCYTATFSSLRAFAAPMRCSQCGDWMIAPLMSEFVESGEIRHYWECDSCGGDLQHLDRIGQRPGRGLRNMRTLGGVSLNGEKPFAVHGEHT